MSEFQEIEIIDCHTHIKGVEGVEKSFFLEEPDYYDSINILAATGFEKSGSHLLNNLFSMLSKARNPGNIYIFGAIHHFPYKTDDLKNDYGHQAEKLDEAGFDGIKMIEGKPDYRKLFGRSLDCGELDDFYSYLEKNNMPLLLHAGDPETFWDKDKVPADALKRGWYYGDGTFLSKEEIYEEVEGLLGKFQGLKVILAHFYFLSGDIERASRFLDKWDNVSFDLTPGVEMYYDFAKDVGAWREFFLKYQDRIMFGTDNLFAGADDVKKRLSFFTNNVNSIRSFLEIDNEDCKFFGKKHRGIGLDRKALRKIYSLNFKRAAGKEPAELSVSSAIRECRKIMDWASKDACRHGTCKSAEYILREFEKLK